MSRLSRVTSRRSAENTRDTILEAARRHFVGVGYKRATIRAIASDAGIDPAMVMRYFGSKEQLFKVATTVDLRLPDLAAVPRQRAGEHLVRFFVGRWEHDESLIALLRSAATNEEPAIATMREIFANQVTPMAKAFVDDPDEVQVRAALVGSQILGLALLRYVVRIPPIAEMSTDELAGWVGPNIQRYLDGPNPSRPPSPEELTGPPES